MTIYAAFGRLGLPSAPPPADALPSYSTLVVSLNPLAYWAVKLTPSDVGLAAPDPFCPSGPQS